MNSFMDRNNQHQIKKAMNRLLLPLFRSSYGSCSLIEVPLHRIAAGGRTAFLPAPKIGPQPQQSCRWNSRSFFSTSVCYPTLTAKRELACSMGTGSSKQVEEGQKKPRFSLKRSRKTKKKEEEQTAAPDQTGEEGTAKQGEGGVQATAAAVVTPEQQQSEEESKQTTEVAPEQQEESKQGDQPASTSQEPAAGAPQEPQDHRDEHEGYVLATVAKASEFGDNEMREVDIGDSKALLVRQNGEFSAIGHKCTHYGAPLVKGCLGNGRVRCPWHGACFNLKSGDIEEFPGLDSVPCFEVRVEGDDVIVKAEKKALEDFRRTAKMSVSQLEEDQRTFLIVGGGPASVACSETLRQEGFKGRILLISRENVLPYDRPKLSKALHLAADAIALRKSDFYSAHDIEVILGKEATGVDVEGKKVNFSDGEAVSYDTLLLATGSKPRSLPIAGFDLDNVFLLREPYQANQIAEAAEGKNVVIIGTSFIGMEVAAYLNEKAASISCIDITAVPFERVLGERIGKVLQAMHEENGVKFYLSAGVKELVGENGKLTGVTLASGETLEADVCIAGVGVVPATGFLKDSGVSLTSRGEVVVDEHMKATEDVYAAGDIVRFPLPLINGNANIGHWQIAHNHGRVAARNMLGKEEAFDSIPYFWTVMFGKSLRYCGFALSWDEIIYEGNPEEQAFAAFYVRDDKVLAVASLGHDPTVSQSAELMYQGKMPSGTQLRENPDLKAYL